MNSFGRLESVDERDKGYLLEDAIPVNAPDKPYRYWHDNAWWGNQGNKPWCVAYAWIHFVEDGPVTHKKVPPPLFAPYDIYYEAQQVDQWPGDAYDGTSVRAGAEILQDRGVIAEYRWTWSVDTLIRTLLGVGPIVVGTRWYAGMSHPHKGPYDQSIISVSGAMLGGHAYCLNGVALGREMFRMKNSWGRNWGTKGRAYISFEDMQTLLDQGGEACMAFEKHLED